MKKKGGLQEAEGRLGRDYDSAEFIYFPFFNHCVGLEFCVCCVLCVVACVNIYKVVSPRK